MLQVLLSLNPKSQTEMSVHQYYPDTPGSMLKPREISNPSHDFNLAHAYLKLRTL